MAAAPQQRDHTQTARLWLVGILIAYFVLGAGFALRTPAWQAPDEPAHYNYVRQVAENGCCPVIEQGDWNQAYLEQLTGARFQPDLLADIETLEYEDHQPPLYYLLAAPTYILSGGSLTALRLFSVVIGAAVVACAYAVGRAMLPERPQIALGAAAFVAFLPQHVAMLASVNNDGLSELVVGLALLLMVRYVKHGNVNARMLGVVAGVGLLTKVNTLFLVGLLPLALLARWRITRAPLHTFVRAIVLFAIPVLVLAGVWWARNVGVYGMPDVFGLRAHDAVVVGQPRTADGIARMGLGEYLRFGAETTFNSFWGQFGWMALPLPGWTYTLIWMLVAGVIAGLLVDVFVLRRRPSMPEQRGAWALMGAVLVLALAQYVYYNLTFQQFQGRYLYPALIPLGLWMALGVDAWRLWLLPRVDVARWLPVGVLGLLGLLDVYLLWRVIPLLAAP